MNEVVTTVQNDDMRIDRVMTTMWYSFAGWIDQITVYTLSHGDTKVVVCTTITLERLVKSLNDLVCFGCCYSIAPNQIHVYEWISCVISRFSLGRNHCRSHSDWNLVPVHISADKLKIYFPFHKST